MGAKYQPNIKDQKASQRFQRKQSGTSKFIRASGAGQPAKTPKKK